MAPTDTDVADRGFSAVLTDPVAGRLLVSKAISEIGDFVGLAALLVLAYRETGSVIGPAAVFAARTLPAVLVGTVFSNWLDRPPRRGALVVLAFTGAVLVAAVAVHPTVVVALAIAALLGAHRTAAVSVSSGAVVDGIAPERRGAFFALSTTINQSAQAVGFLIGAAATVAIGARASLMFDAATFVAAGAVLVRMPTISTSRRDRRPGPIEGLRTIFSEPTLRVLAPIVWVAMLGMALPETVAPRIGHGVLLPLLMAAAPFGAMVAALTFGRGNALRDISRQLHLVLLLGIGFGFGAIVLASGGSPWLLVAVNGAVGVASVWVVGARTTFADRTPAGRMAQVEATMVASIVVTEGLGVLGLGWLATTAGPWAGYAVVAVCTIGATAPKLWPLRRPAVSRSGAPAGVASSAS